MFAPTPIVLLQRLSRGVFCPEFDHSNHLNRFPSGWPFAPSITSEGRVSLESTKDPTLLHSFGQSASPDIWGCQQTSQQEPMSLPSTCFLSTLGSPSQQRPPPPSSSLALSLIPPWSSLYVVKTCLYRVSIVSCLFSWSPWPSMSLTCRLTKRAFPWVPLNFFFSCYYQKA